MEFLIEYLKTNIKYAAKSVFLKFKEYIPFFAALLVIQTVFLTLFITTATNNFNNSKILSEKFDYDVVVSGLDENQNAALSNSLRIESLMKRRSFESYYSKKASELEGGDYRFYFVMREGVSLSDFIKVQINSILGDTDNISISTSPRYDNKISQGVVSSYPPPLLIALMCIISIAAVSAIYSIRINNQKFMYGIYITFGANLSKLISTATFEMLLLSFLSFFPALGLTYLVTYLSYATFGTLPVINAGIIIRVIISIFIVTLAGAYLPMKIVSRKAPVSLISADDNSNLVWSPRRSSNMRKKLFPKHYELLSFWRFRKHYAKILLTSVIFTSVFICGFYISDMFTMNTSQPIEEFTITNTTDVYNEECANDLRLLNEKITEFDGVKAINWNIDTPASLVSDIMVVSADNRRNASGYFTTTTNALCADEGMQAAYNAYGEEGLNTVTNSFKYSALDQTTLSYIEENYRVEGDVYSVLNEENTVIISEEIFNSRRFKFKVGDKIVLGMHQSTITPYDGNYFDTVRVLDHSVEQIVYEFREFTVGAIIKNYGDSEGYLTVGLSPENYRMLTDKEPVPHQIQVLLEPEANTELADKLEPELETLIYYMGSNYSIDRRNEAITREITIAQNHRSFAIFLSSLVVIMSPVVWFFSQTMFFKKRSKELFVLRAFGAREAKIEKMFNYSGAIMSSLGFILSTLMSLPASYLVYMTMNTWLPSLGFGGSAIRYDFHVSLSAVIICAIISAASGFLSSFIPYKISTRSSRKAKQYNDYGGEIK